MSLTSPDFESGAYTNFATPASRGEIIKPVALRRNHVDQLCAVWGVLDTSRGPGCSTSSRLEARIIASPLI